MSANPKDGLGGRLDGVRHVLTLRIYYEDTDFSGAVYHASYLRFMERGRTEMLRAIGFDHRLLYETEGLGFVVRRMEIDYRKPARMDDMVAVESAVHQVKSASLILDQQVVREGEVLVSARTTVAFIGGGRPRRMPGKMRRDMLRTE